MAVADLRSSQDHGEDTDREHRDRTVRTGSHFTCPDISTSLNSLHRFSTSAFCAPGTAFPPSVERPGVTMGTRAQFFVRTASSRRAALSKHGHARAILSGHPYCVSYQDRPLATLHRRAPMCGQTT